jgi:dihydroorotate dehydrogenase (NAD+) catalytic subunit
MPDLSTKLAGVDLRSPVLVASGTFGAGREGSYFVPLNQLGGVIVKSTTLVPWKGKPTPRMCETPSGMLNSIGIQNKGIDNFLSTDLPWLLKHDATVFASMAGNTVDEYVRIADKLRTGGRGIAAVEINISCPNLEDQNNMFGHSVDATTAVIAGVRKALPKASLFAKLSPNVTSLTEIAGAAIEAGADGLSLINTLFGMAIDVENRRPKLAGVTGGLSGPAIRPVAVRAVWEVHNAFPHIPIIGQGGIATAEDALEFMLAGAGAVAIGTTNFINPRSSLDVTKGIDEYMERNDIASVSELVGALKTEG